MHDSDVKWLESHFFERSDTNEWRLRYYNGMFMTIRLRDDGCSGYVSFCNESGRLEAEGSGRTAEEAAMNMVEALKTEIVPQLLEDLDVTGRALKTGLAYDTAESGFYDGMPGLDEADNDARGRSE